MPVLYMYISFVRLSAFKWYLAGPLFKKIGTLSPAVYLQFSSKPDAIKLGMVNK